MRRPLLIDCEATTLAACLHPADGATGVLIVTGGVQTRCGAHRGFVDLGDQLMRAGIACLRFDRRGNGDSDGSDPGFRDSRPDIAAAVAALRRAQPHLRQIIGWGLCDGASALALHAAAIDGLDALILTNPWTLDTDGMPEIPPRAAVAARYAERLRDPRAWLRLARGKFDLRRALKGLARLAVREPIPQLAREMAAGLTRFERPVLILLAERDATAQAFAAVWRTAPFRRIRTRRNIRLENIPHAGHTFERQAEAEAMATACLDWLLDRRSA